MQRDMNLVRASCAFSIAAALLGRCSHAPTKQHIGTATGAMVGGADGAVLPGTTTDTAVGAGAGAVIGSEIGESMERKR